MKHQNEVAALQRELTLRGIRVPDDSIARSLDYLEALLEANKKTNVTSIRDFADAATLHVLDSLLALPAVDECPTGPALDLGTGGGFPGVPLALASCRRFTLLDSVAKKVDTVDACLREIGVEGIRTVGTRSELLAEKQPAAFSCVVARAVSSLPTVLELARPLLRHGGRLVAFRGPKGAEETRQAEVAASTLGYELVSFEEYRLPRADAARSIAVFEVTREAKVVLPRRPGLAAKRPYG